MRFNINDYVKVRLTEYGKKIHRQQYRELKKSLPITSEFNYVEPKEDAEGWSTWQMWLLMERFGPYMNLGGPIPFETEIEIVKPVETE